MKTRPVVVVVLSLVLLIANAPPSAAHVLQSPITSQPPSLGELTIPTVAAGASASLQSAPMSPSSNLPCEFAGWATPYYEGFDSVIPPVLPPGWATSPISGTEGLWQTNVGTHEPTGGIAPSPWNLVYFNSYSSLPGQTARLYRTTALDLRHYSNVFLCLRWYRDSGYQGYNDRVQAQVSTNGGSSWTDVGPALTRYYANNGWWTVGIGITSEAAGQPSVYIGFLGISEFGNDVHLDDIQVTAVPLIYLPLIVR